MRLQIKRLSLMSNYSSLIHKGLGVGVIQYKAVTTILLLNYKYSLRKQKQTHRSRFNASLHASVSVESVHACGNITLGLKCGWSFYLYERFWSEEETEYKWIRVNYRSPRQTLLNELNVFIWGKFTHVHSQMFLLSHMTFRPV